MTINLLSPDILAYSEAHTTAESETLATLNRETNVKVELPVMLSGHLQGAFLQMMSHAIKPRSVLEIGTYTGYSAICLAQGMTEGGVLHTIDTNEELFDMVERYVGKAGLQGRVIAHTGKAAEVIPSLQGPFDLVFIDADKVNYGLYFDLVIDLVPAGGFILADNVLYEGEVLLPSDKQPKNARAMDAFNKKIAADQRVEQLLLPLRDGIMVIRKR